MKSITIGIALAAVALVAISSAGAPDLHQQHASARQAAAQTQKALRFYSWLEVNTWLEEPENAGEQKDEMQDHPLWSQAWEPDDATSRKRRVPRSSSR